MRQLFLLVALLFSGLTQAGGNPFETKPDFLPVDKAFVFTSERLESGETQLFWQIADGYYLYQKRLKFDGLAVEQHPALPEGEAHSDEFFGEQQVYRQGLELKLPAGASGQVKVSYQGCADAGLCYPPQTRVVDLGNSNALGTANEAPDQAQASNLQQRALGWSLLVFFGLGLLLAAGVAALAKLCCRLPKVPSAVLRALLAVVLAAGIAANGAFTRGCLRTHHAENLKAYNFFADTIRAGLADEVTADDLILCNENVWDTNTQAETNFFCRFAGRELHAQMPGIELPSGHGTLYAYQTYRNYGGYDLAWCGRLTDDTGEVMDGMRVYVQGALVPDNAVIKYKVRLADGTEETRQICLLDCDRTPRNEKGEYIATVEDTSILNAKVMIWDG